MYLAQGHNAVAPVRLEAATPQSQVKHSTTEPLQSLSYIGQKSRSILAFLAHRIRISEILPRDRKSYQCYLTQDV